MSLFSKLKSGSEALETAKQVQDETHKTQTEIELLKDKVEKLTQICHSLWQIIMENLHLEEAVLEEKVKEIEELDEAPPVQCVSCGRPIHIKKRKCVFCGAGQPDRGFFNTL